MTEAVTLGTCDRVEAVLRHYTWPWLDDNRAVIAAHWARRRAARPAMFNGRVLLASRADLAEGVMRLDLFETEFAALLALRDLGFPDGTAHNVFGAAALRSADGAFLLGRMNRHTASAGQVYFACGTPDLADVAPDGTVDLAASTLRELREETGLGPEGGTTGRWTVVREAGYLALFLPLTLAEDAAALAARMRAHLAAQDEPELAEIVTVRGPEDIDPSCMPRHVQAYLRAAFGA